MTVIIMLLYENGLIMLLSAVCFMLVIALYCTIAKNRQAIEGAPCEQSRGADLPSTARK